MGAAVVVNAAGDRVFAATQESRSARGSYGGSPTVLSVFAYGCLSRGLRPMEQVRLPEILKANRLVCHGDELLVVGLGGVVAMKVDDGAGRLGPARHVVPSGAFSDAVVHAL